MDLEQRNDIRIYTPSIKEQFVCIYRDQAEGAKPISLYLEVAGIGPMRLSSDYFAAGGVGVYLVLSGDDEIIGLRLGEKVHLSLNSMQSGVLFKPLSLFPAHVMQADPTFSAKEGGVLRFGYLKKVFSWKTFWLSVQRILFKPGKNGKLSVRDLISHWRDTYGENDWGTFDVVVKKSSHEKWGLFVRDEQGQEMYLISELITKFDVNRCGIVTGLKKMWGIVSE